MRAPTRKVESTTTPHMGPFSGRFSCTLPVEYQLHIPLATCDPVFCAVITEGIHCNMTIAHSTIRRKAPREGQPAIDVGANRCEYRLTPARGMDKLIITSHTNTVSTTLMVGWCREHARTYGKSTSDASSHRREMCVVDRIQSTSASSTRVNRPRNDGCTACTAAQCARAS